MPIPSSLIVEVDTRERDPFLFPGTVELWVNDRPRIVSVETVRTKLDAGDYRLAEARDQCVIERKGSLREVWSNLFSKDSSRQLRAFGRLAHSSRSPYLFLQVAPAEWLTPTAYVPSPQRLLARLSRCLDRFGLSLCQVSPSNAAASLRVAGTLALILMAGHAGFTDVRG